MIHKHPRSTLVIVALIALAGAGAYTHPASATDELATMSLEIQSTEANVPASGVVLGHQDVVLRFEYNGLGSGGEMRLVEKDTVFNDEVMRFTVSGSSGTKTIRLSSEQLAETQDIQAEDAGHFVVKWGEEASSNTVMLWWQDTTVYTRGYGQIPEEVPPNEEITIEYYGWTSESQSYVRLMEDDPPLNTRAGGNDDQIRRQSVSGPGYFEGTFTFTPASLIDDEESDGKIELQARPAGENNYPDIVRGITIGEPEPEIEASILDLTPPSGEYYTGQTVRSRVVVENTGDEQHTFFVGYGAIDESGNVYDNGGTTGTRVRLEPGERQTVTVSWTVESNAPTGTYGVGAAVWEESNPNNLNTRLDETRTQDVFAVVGTPTATQSLTPTPTASPTLSPTLSPTDSATQQATVNEDGDVEGAEAEAQVEEEDSGATATNPAGPGFGLVAALIALMSAALLSNRW